MLCSSCGHNGVFSNFNCQPDEVVRSIGNGEKFRLLLCQELNLICFIVVGSWELRGFEFLSLCLSSTEFNRIDLLHVNFDVITPLHTKEIVDCYVDEEHLKMKSSCQHY